MWMHASVYRSLCTPSLRANCIYTEVLHCRLTRHLPDNGREENMLRSDYEALNNCDPAVICNEHTEFTESLKSDNA